MSEQRPGFLARATGVLLCLGLLLSGRAMAANLTNLASVTVAWERSTDDQLTNGITYKVYASQPAFLLTTTNVLAGTNTSVTFTNLAPGTWRFFGVSVWANLESLPSNSAYYVVPTNAPSPPGKFAIVYLEQNDILTGTNWNNFGNFRARIYIP